MISNQNQGNETISNFLRIQNFTKKSVHTLKNARSKPKSLKLHF